MALEFLRYWQLTSKEIRFYDTYGYLCLPGLISREAAAELADEVLQVMEGLGISRGKPARGAIVQRQIATDPAILGGYEPGSLDSQ